MTEFFAQYGATILICGILIAAAVAAVFHIVKTRKRGGCTGCPSEKNCNCGCSEQPKK